MFRRPRVIPCLLIHDEGLVKTIGFKNEIYLGDPINAVKIFNEKGVDELCILDIGAAKTRKEPDIGFLKKIASEAFMPLSYGGGIHSLESIGDIFRNGFEKVVLNTVLYENPFLVKEAVEKYGSQSIIASIDYKKTWLGKHLTQYRGGAVSGDKSPLEMVKTAFSLGVGEILLTSIDHEGKMLGYDDQTIKECAESVEIPVIANGGCGNLEDMRRVLNEFSADAVSAGSFFVFFGKKRGILIHAPTEEEFIKQGIYKESNNKSQHIFEG